MENKFKALVHYIVSECDERNWRLGSVRLNKALWFTDMLAYQLAGAPITGSKYVKRQRGPVPEKIINTINELVEEEKILVQEQKFAHLPRKYVSLRPPEAGFLSEGDRDLIENVLEWVCECTAQEISDFTHEEIWEAAQEGEEIPLYASLISGKGQITDEVRIWAQQSIEDRASI